MLRRCGRQARLAPQRGWAALLLALAACGRTVADPDVDGGADGSIASPDAACDVLCAPGARRCLGDTVERCVPDRGSCFVWRAEEDCAQRQRICAASGASAQCEAPCVDTCSPVGATRCFGERMERCGLGAAGCLQWEVQADCGAAGTTCVSAAEGARCAECVDECANLGEVKCANDAVQTCSLGPGNCIGWQTVQKCAATEEMCVDDGGAHCEPLCPDECLPGATRCAGKVVEHCLETSECNTWAPLIDCGAGSSVCIQGASKASCLPLGISAADYCANSVVLNKGKNTIYWAAVFIDFFGFHTPSCLSPGASVIGPDLVVEYKPSAGFDGTVTIDVQKPAAAPWVTMVSDVACSVVQEVACAGDQSPAHQLTFPAVGTKTYFVYLATTALGHPITKPLVINVTETPSP